MFAYMQGDYSAALLQLEEAADIARELPAPKLLGQTFARTRLVGVHTKIMPSRKPTWRRPWQRRTLGDKYEIGSTLVHLGSAICEQRDYARAQCLLCRRFGLFEELGIAFDIADAHYWDRHGAAAGDYLRAWDSCALSLARWRNWVSASGAGLPSAWMRWR